MIDIDKKRKNTTKIYVGPTIRGVADKNTIFLNGIPAGAERMINELPIFGNLFIPVVDAPKAQKMIKEKKGYAYTAYRETLKFLKRGE